MSLSSIMFGVCTMSARYSGRRTRPGSRKFIFAASRPRRSTASAKPVRKSRKWRSAPKKQCHGKRFVRPGLFQNFLEKLKKRGYKILAVEQSKNSIPYYKFKNQKSKIKIAVIVGNEVNGLPKNILKNADKILEIPMKGRKESLNVSVAFGIALFGLLYTR